MTTNWGLNCRFGNQSLDPYGQAWFPRSGVGTPFVPLRGSLKLGFPDPV
jgi:hypothetical protein